MNIPAHPDGNGDLEKRVVSRGKPIKRMAVLAVVLLAVFVAFFDRMLFTLHRAFLNDAAGESHAMAIFYLILLMIVLCPFFIAIKGKEWKTTFWIVFRPVWGGIFLAAIFLAQILPLMVHEGFTPGQERKETIQGNPNAIQQVMKPVIYLYPRATEKVRVELEYKGRLHTTYPVYNPAIKGWSVTAHPDGTLVNDADGEQYSYLFWEGDNDGFPLNRSEGFVVKGADTAQFLQTTLAKLGLTPREYNEFIVFWLPRMQDNPYNFIRFAGSEYTQSAPLKITPRPDSMLRVFMFYQKLQTPVQVREQQLSSFRRHGFTVIEWGGTEIEN
jgi:hypothetical protein